MEPECVNCGLNRDKIDTIIADRIKAGADYAPVYCCTIERLARLRPARQNTQVQEAFVPPQLYPQIRKLQGVPDLQKFPQGIYILGTWGFSQILAFSPTPMLDKIKDEQEKTDAIQTRAQPQTSPAH